jgi:hypothetical protein
VSRISEIARQYHTALTVGLDQYDELCRERAAAAADFYRDFFSKLVLPFSPRFKSERIRAQLQERIERQTGSRSLSFVAIDGSCRRELFNDLVTFFGGAYGARGEIELTGGDHRIRYKRWSLNEDVSVVAWVPIPYARLEEVSPPPGDQFVVTEEEKINLTTVHTKVMQLAEIFLACNVVRSSRIDAPHILMMDLLPSSVLAAVAQRQDQIGLEGYPYDRRALTSADIAVALAHPFSEHLGIPSAKKMDRSRLLLAALAKAPASDLDLAAVAARHGLAEAELRSSADRLVRQGVLERPRIGRTGYRPKIRVDESWAYTRDFFQNLCSRLFLAKEPGALQYDAADAQGYVRRRWMAPADLDFLLAVGLRLLIEECWERKVLLYGVAKDSTSAYLTRNFLGVSLETGFHPELRDLAIGPLPWTDRLFCETLSRTDETLAAPWSTIEFDSAFMTLHRERLNGSGATRVAGVMGRIVNQERLFARSLGQFFLRRGKGEPLMGHVVFLERLLSKTWDGISQDVGPAEIPIDTPDLGRFSVYAWRDREHVNPGQWVMMYLLSVLTRNHFAEAIG